MAYSNDLISSEEFYYLKTLSNQLRICSENESVHIDCILGANKIGRSCIEISTLLDVFFSRLWDSPSELASILTELVESCENAIDHCLKSTDRLDVLCQWTIILKVLDESLQRYPVMWNNLKSPKNVRDKLEEDIKKRDEKDVVRKVLMEAPEFKDFLKMKSIEEEFSEVVEKVIVSNLTEEVIEKIIRTIPESFKFTASIFDKLFKLEHDLSLKNGLTQSFYNFLFFTYENAHDQNSVCQQYVNLEGRYSDDFKKQRNDASSDAYIAFYSKLIGILIGELKKTAETTQMFHWLYVMRPDALASLISEHGDFFEPLPTIPSKESSRSNVPEAVQEARKLNRPSVIFDLTKKPPQILNGPIELIRSAGGENSEVPSTRKKQEIEECGDTFKQFVKKTEQSDSPKVLPNETVNSNMSNRVSSGFGVSNTVVGSAFSLISTLCSDENATIGSSRLSPRGGYQQPRGMEFKSNRRGVSMRYHPGVRDFSKYGSGILEKLNGADGTPTGDKSL